MRSLSFSFTGFPPSLEDDITLFRGRNDCEIQSWLLALANVNRFAGVFVESYEVLIDDCGFVDVFPGEELIVAGREPTHFEFSGSVGGCGLVHVHSKAA